MSATGQAPVGLASASDFEIEVKNLLGRTTTVFVRKDWTIRRVKDELEMFMDIPARSQHLIRRTSGDQIGYEALEESKTVGDYNIAEGEQLLVIPAMKAAPHDHVKHPNEIQVFVDPPGSSAVSSLINDILAANKQAKDPNSFYVLTRKSDQAPGNFALYQLGIGGNGQQQQPIAAEKAPAALEGLNVITEADERQNVKTKSTMGKLRANIDDQKQRKKQVDVSAKACSKCGLSPCRCKSKRRPFDDPRPSCCIS